MVIRSQVQIAIHPAKVILFCALLKGSSQKGDYNVSCSQT